MFLRSLCTAEATSDATAGSASSRGVRDWSRFGLVCDECASNKATKPHEAAACFSRLSANFPSCKASDSCQPI